MKLRKTYFSIIAIAIIINVLPLFTLIQATSSTSTDSQVSDHTPLTEEELHLLFSSDYIPPDARYARSGTDQTTTIYTSDQTPVTALIHVEMDDDRREQMQAHIARQYPEAYEISPRRTCTIVMRTLGMILQIYG